MTEASIIFPVYWNGNEEFESRNRSVKNKLFGKTEEEEWWKFFVCFIFYVRLSHTEEILEA